MNNYITKDTPLAAFLWTLDGVDYVSASRNGFSVFFEFQYSMGEEEFAEITRSWDNDRALVEPKLYEAKLRQCRSIVHQTKASE